MGKSKKKINNRNQNVSIQSIIELLEEIQNNEFVIGSSAFLDDIRRLTDRLKDTSFKLAIVGEFSSGKSTFLNALIGRDLLKHGRKETTAAITEIYNDKSVGKEILIDVYCNNGTVKRNIPVGDIMNVTATESSDYSVANDIDKVTIRSSILENDSNICFVDTPGLNGIADKHREKTIEQIKSSHACIYLLQVRGIGESDIEFLKYICKYQQNIIFVQNFIDELKSLEGETPEQKIEAQRKIIDERIINEQSKVKYSIVGVSARKALISKVNEFTQYNGEELTHEVRERLYEESGFDSVLDCINGLIESNVKDKVQQRDTIEVALILLKHLNEMLQLENQIQEEKWNNSVEGINAKNNKKILEVLKQKHDFYNKRLDDYIESEISEIRKSCNREILNEIEAIETNLRNTMAMLEKIDLFEKYIAESLPNYLYSKISEMEDTLNAQLNVKYENLICNAVSRIKQYIGSQMSEISINEFQIKMETSKLQRFSEEENEVTVLQKKIAEKRRINEKYTKDKENMIAEKERIDKSIKEYESNIDNNEIVKNQKIAQLGEKPKREKKERSETYYEYRGGIGIMDAIFGPKERTRWVTYYDDSAQQKWEKRKSDIETKYRDKENSYKSQKRILEERKKQCDEDLMYIYKLEKSRQNEIIGMESLLEAKIKNLEVQREKAQREYLREAKKAVIENVDVYLREQIQSVLIDNFADSITENKKEIQKLIFSLYEMTYNQRLSVLNNMIIDSKDRYDDNKFDVFSGTVEKAIDKMEVFLCQY